MSPTTQINLIKNELSRGEQKRLRYSENKPTFSFCNVRIFIGSVLQKRRYA
jgi:hypothetical protein